MAGYSYLILRSGRTSLHLTACLCWFWCFSRQVDESLPQCFHGFEVDKYVAFKGRLWVCCYEDCLTDNIISVQKLYYISHTDSHQ